MSYEICAAFAWQSINIKVHVTWCVYIQCNIILLDDYICIAYLLITYTNVCSGDYDSKKELLKRKDRRKRKWSVLFMDCLPPSCRKIGMTLEVVQRPWSHHVLLLCIIIKVGVLHRDLASMYEKKNVYTSSLLRQLIKLRDSIRGIISVWLKRISSLLIFL